MSFCYLELFKYFIALLDENCEVRSVPAPAVSLNQDNFYRDLPDREEAPYIDIEFLPSLLDHLLFPPPPPVPGHSRFYRV